MRKPPAYLFGPFVGELAWEFFRFAPFVIHTKKEHPDIQMIVFTRQARFDLYGNYADILVPLRIPNDENFEKNCFRLDSLKTRDYNKIANKFRSQYKKRYNIIDHFYPDVRGWRYKVKWQFPRRHMDYDFKPRITNVQIAKKYVNRNNIIADNIYIEHTDITTIVNSKDFFSMILNQINDYDSTSLGCLIEALKICKGVVGNLESHLSHLAILLKKPLICVDNKLEDDSIALLNPLKTKIKFANNIEEGIEEWI